MSETSFEPFTTDNYFEQYKPTAFVVKGQKVTVVNEQLADALSKLPEQRRTVLLTAFSGFAVRKLRERNRINCLRSQSSME